MKIGDEVYIHGYVDEIRQNVVIIRNDGGYFGTVAEEITNKSENPNTCGDTISRQAVFDAFWKLDVELSPNAINAILKMVKELPPISSQTRTPQPKMGHWEWVRYDGIMGNWHCSECRTIIPHMPEETDNTPIYKWCPMCGIRMVQEVEE